MTLDVYHGRKTTIQQNNKILAGSILLTVLHSERPKLHTILAFLSAIGLKGAPVCVFMKKEKHVLSRLCVLRPIQQSHLLSSR